MFISVLDSAVLFGYFAHKLHRNL